MARRKTITRKDMGLKIAERMNLESELVDEIITAFVDSFKESILAGDKIELRNFGVFQMLKRAPKVGRLITSNTQINLPESNYLSFKAGKEMKDKINTPDA